MVEGPTRDSFEISGKTLAALNSREVEAPDYPLKTMYMSRCSRCGQTFDERLLGDTLYHATVGDHRPLAGKAPRLIRID